MLKSIIANLKPCKRAHYFVFVRFDSPSYQIFERLADESGICTYFDENKDGTKFKMDLAYSAN